LPRDTGLNECADVRLLVTKVVEIQNPRIRLAAVHAWMIEEVLAHSTLELGRRMAAPLFGLRDLLFPVARVPLVCIGALTQEADPLSRLVPQRPIWKLSEGLGLVTHATRSYSERRLER